ncbi:MAG: GNAT family N-acetyltransferase [Planctomycetales bacterium]|nr:GNAT family N-acetyltransferase [Planctomycetales bacterium]
MQLSLKHCGIRSWRAEDAATLPQFANNRNISRNLRDTFPHPYTADHASSFIATALDQSPETHFAIEVDGLAVGGIGVRLRDDIERYVAELGYWLGEPFWGHGIATEAVTAISSFAIREYSLQRIEAWVFHWNPASARVLEKAGYRWEATLRRSAVKEGQVIDRMLYALLPEIPQDTLTGTKASR